MSPKDRDGEEDPRQVLCSPASGSGERESGVLTSCYATISVLGACIIS